MDIKLSLSEQIIDRLVNTPDWEMDAECVRLGVKPDDTEAMLDACKHCPVLDMCRKEVLLSLQQRKNLPKFVAAGEVL